jgi:hypothetical protein
MSAALAAEAMARAREVPRSRAGRPGRPGRTPRSTIPTLPLQQSLVSASPMSKLPAEIHHESSEPFSTSLPDNTEPFSSPPVRPPEGFSPHQSNSEPYSSPGDNAFPEPFSPREHTDSSDPFPRRRNNGTLEPFTPQKRNDAPDTPSSRRGNTHKRAEEPPRDPNGKILCRFSSCAGLVFERRCEWR